MNRRDFMTVTAAAVAGTATGPVPGAPAGRARNILMIPVDDLKPLLGCYGDPDILTPNIDRLAARGTVFLNNCCQQAVCGPTRASLMTGLYPDTTGVWDLKTRMRDVNPDVLSLPQYLVSRGYETTGAGKTYDPRCVGTGWDAPSWSIRYGSEKLRFSDAAPRPTGGYQNPATKAAFAAGKKAVKGRTFSSGGARKRAMAAAAGPLVAPATECMDVPDDAYPDGALAKAGCRLLERLAADEKPFFLSVGFYKPHLPFVAPKKYWDLYDRSTIEPHPFQDRSKNGPALAYHNSGELRSYSDMPSKGPLTRAQQIRLIHGYRACVSFTDAQVGKLLDKLDELKLADNTVVCLWGDHGWHLGDHAMWCKHSNFEQAVRAPLIVAAPGIPGGRTTDAPTGFVDVFPTLCDLAGVPVPAHLHGESLAPVMADPSATVREAILSQYPRRLAGRPVMGYALRDKRYRYVKWLQLDYRRGARTGLLAARELYDYKTDPHETVNLADVPAHAATVARFERLFREMNVARHTGVFVDPAEAPAVNGVGGVLFNGRGECLTWKPVAVKNRAFDRADEIAVTAVPAKRSRAAYKRPIMLSLEAGGEYRVSFLCRSAAGARFRAIFQQNGKPYTALAREEVTATAAWRKVELVATAGADYAPGRTVLTCHLGSAVQTVQFADVRAAALE